MARPHTVTFDCWGTLIYEPEPGRAFEIRLSSLTRVASAAAGRRIDEKRAQAALDTAWRRHWEHWQARRASGSKEMAVWSLEALGLAGEEAASWCGPLEQAFSEASLVSGAATLEGARETLVRLAAAGVRRALVCDTGFSPGRVVRQLLDRAGLLELLEVQAFSDEVGVSKPHPRIFHRVLTALECEAADALHVGDLRRTDVAGARNVGMRTVRIRHHYDDRSEHPEADQVADDHAHLLEILGID
jgi:putative hydrolase of the HAD superfamily